MNNGDGGDAEVCTHISTVFVSFRFDFNEV